MQDRKNVGSGHRSLADHLAASCIDNTLNTPDGLSEDIVRCISSIYCKLANHPHTHSGLSTSPSSSLSSSSIFSSKNPCDSLSPHYNEDASLYPQLQVLREDSGPYAAMVEVLKICLDDDSFNFAAKMLQTFRWSKYTSSLSTSMIGHIHYMNMVALNFGLFSPILLRFKKREENQYLTSQDFC